jgi:hypothetical protein
MTSQGRKTNALNRRERREQSFNNLRSLCYLLFKFWYFFFCLCALAPLRETFFGAFLGVSEDSVNEHRDGAGQEQHRADADREVPKCLTLAGEGDAHVDHREANAVEGVEDDGGQEGDLAEFEQGRAESFESAVECLGVLQVVNCVNVEDQIAD